MCSYLVMAKQLSAGRADVQPMVQIQLNLCDVRSSHSDVGMGQVKGQFADAGVVSNDPEASSVVAGHANKVHVGLKIRQIGLRGQGQCWGEVRGMAATMVHQDLSCLLGAHGVAHQQSVVGLWGKSMGLCGRLVFPEFSEAAGVVAFCVKNGFGLSVPHEHQLSH